MLSTAMRALRADPPHVDTIKRADATIAAARTKLDRARAERARFHEAGAAAAELARVAREEAQRLAGAAAIGEGDAAQAKEAAVNADAADRRRTAVDTTIAGLDGIEAAAQREIADAEAERQAARQAAIALDAQAVAAEFRAAHDAYTRALRRARALERIATSMGAPITLLRGFDHRLELPSLRDRVDDDPPLVGRANDCWYSAVVDGMADGPQAQAEAAERARLVAAGIL
jgi:hypothetical protein